ncbi:bifunctional folylpolyglutamate synthase/dihydrofolate synthase [Devosia pacifica]|uniref:Dihydrofolate synthase/folylpolyglutamate synthase n=1 Tax=Devosia pacifica TaxID=1335967 RepID=A0A918VSM2_9HYPH|nr:folylpolyglutamate synthase/dihydrofolate synthase family protein [Devosia pacifica]GHA21140.1 bifunctional folylpolyglutamate synthase/dihydrofolate synthase [Devosia pacifica]
MSRTDAILARLLTLHSKSIDLSLDRIEALLADLGSPHLKVPPVIHVAGTNGKGSTVATLRAFLEAAGKSVHVYTSPHLVNFNERIRLAGQLVTAHRLNAALERCEAVNAGRPITFFEITTAAAFCLFAEEPADYLLLEVGMGGEYDTTNVVPHPLGTIITTVSLDHQQFLGDTVGEIASVKAGILKRGAPAVIARQTDEGETAILKRARALGVTPFAAGQDFDSYASDGRMVYQDEAGLLDLPRPRLVGAHQIDNAGLAIAATRHFGLPVSDKHIAAGLGKVDWPARLSPLSGKLADMLPRGHELWLDGGHNANGAEALARALATMNETRPAPLVMILGMMNTRKPEDFLVPFAELNPTVMGVTIPGEDNALKASEIARRAKAAGFSASSKRSVVSALADAAAVPDARVVICGSLYLAGDVLERNGTPPA